MPDDLLPSDRAPKSQPIAEAPIRDGEGFGPVLLFVRDGRLVGWVVGRWNGYEWCDEEGLTIAPIAFSPLPPDPPI